VEVFKFTPELPNAKKGSMPKMQTCIELENQNHEKKA
jgi:hypothetical protein